MMSGNVDGRFPAFGSLFPKHPNWVTHPAAKSPYGSIQKLWHSWLPPGPPACLCSLLHQTSDLSAHLKPSPPCVLPQHLPRQSPFLLQIDLPHFCHAHPWLQPHPPAALQAPHQPSAAAIHPHPTAGPLCGCPCPMCSAPASQPSRAGGMAHPLPPCALSRFPQLRAPRGVQTTMLRLGQPLALPWLRGTQLHARTTEWSPHGFQESLTTFSVICQRRLFQLALGVSNQHSSLWIWLMFLITHFTLH